LFGYILDNFKGFFFSGLVGDFQFSRSGQFSVFWPNSSQLIKKLKIALTLKIENHQQGLKKKNL
jgi:hypothetical protein